MQQPIRLSDVAGSHGCTCLSTAINKWDATAFEKLTVFSIHNAGLSSARGFMERVVVEGTGLDKEWDAPAL